MSKGSSIYEELRFELDKARKLSYNLAVVSIPGLGASRLLKKYANEEKATYIKKPGEELGRFSILDLGLDIHSEGLEWIEEYFHKAGPGQSVAVAINTPFIFETEEYQKSFSKSHIYKLYWLKALGPDETKEMLEAAGTELSEEEKLEIYKKSGGIPQIAKYLLAGDDSQLTHVLEPITKVVNSCSKDVLEKMGILENGKLKSKLLAESINPMDSIDIKVEFDLSFFEKSKLNPEKLTQSEAKILKKIVYNKGKISKEEVSDIKWGEGKYDEFSDQAINKTMRRLNEKLSLYMIETIPKVGYKVVERSAG